ncbi:Phosphoinositide phosphatase SAC2, partial [Ananas comosus]
MLQNFYLFGSDESRTSWRVLKIDRSEPSELNIREDFSTYTQCECFDLLKRIDEGNRSTGGLKFVTTCYGIIGFVKFLGPYYMLLITERKQIGAICGHAVYKITKTDMIMLPNSCMQSNLVNKDENRYKKLLCTIDLTKDFFFSYSYHIMRSLQKNLRDKQKGQALYETMFVWNEFLTRGIRNHLKNTLWTVALVYGYLKRGVNEKGRVANDVETEQIVSEEILISSVVQTGFIPLFWSQETSKLNIKPDIILHHKDRILRAIKFLNNSLTERTFEILHWDLNKILEQSQKRAYCTGETICNTDDVDTLCDGSQEDVSLSSDVSGHAIAEDKVKIVKFALSNQQSSKMIFSERRGHLKLAIQSQEFLATSPQEGKPAIWELDSDQHCNLGYDHHFPYKTSRWQHSSRKQFTFVSCDARVNGGLNKALSDSIEETSNGMNKVSYSRTTPTIPLKQLLINGEYTFYYEPGDSNFLNLDSLYSSGWEEETYERSTAASTPVGNLSLENVINGIATETSTPPSVTGI